MAGSIIKIFAGETTEYSLLALHGTIQIFYAGMDRHAGQGKTITSMILREELQRYLFLNLLRHSGGRERERGLSILLVGM